jgi:carbamoyl-phosphate synthase large subunit
MLESNHVLVPKTFSLNDWVSNTALQPASKWILKPVNGVSSRGIIIANTIELRNTIATRVIKEDYLVQEYISGTEYTVDVFVKNKIPYCVVPRIREEVREGLCYKASTLDNKDFLEPVKKILPLFDFYGPINIQFIRDHITNKLYCIECNPRFGGSSVISLYAGINLFDLIIKDYQKEELEINNKYQFVYMTRYWEEVYYDI